MATRNTDRQAEVLRRIMEGKPNKIIAWELGIMESTVKVHIRNLMSRHGVPSRSALQAKLAPTAPTVAAEILALHKEISAAMVRIRDLALSCGVILPEE